MTTKCVTRTKKNLNRCKESQKEGERKKKRKKKKIEKGKCPGVAGQGQEANRTRTGREEDHCDE